MCGLYILLATNIENNGISKMPLSRRDNMNRNRDHKLEALLYSAIDTEEKTAVQLKHELKLRQNPRQIGKAMVNVINDHPEILWRKYAGIKKYWILTKKEISTPKEKTVQPAHDTAVSPQELKTLIADMAEQGIDVQAIVYETLKLKKNEVDKEMEVAKVQTPTLLSEYKKMKERIRGLMNTISDLKDSLRLYESKDMVRRVSEERKAQAGVF